MGIKNLTMLTKEQAITEHRKMWNWIADRLEEAEKLKNDGNLKSPDLYDVYKLKRKYVENYGSYILCSCFCCEYDKQQYCTDDDERMDCKYCPLLWGTENEMDSFFCEGGTDMSDFKRKYYIVFFTTFETMGLWGMANRLSGCNKYKEAAEIARQIANLPEKPDKKGIE